MLKVHPRNCVAPAKAWQEGESIEHGAVWLDLVDPSEAEIQAAHQFSGVRIPRRDELTGLTLSSRMSSDKDTFYLSVPYFAANHDDQPAEPLGVVLSPHVMLTVRFAESKAFEMCAQSAEPGDFATSGDVFAALFESIVDLAAERMESVAGDLRKLSERVFSIKHMGTPVLRRCMLEVGRLESIQTRTRTSMLSVQRIIVFVRGIEPSYMDDRDQTRLRIVDHDLRTLDEFDDQLTNKLQFLLDASLGFINTDQNHVMKVLTVVSVATVPPVILAGIWGMNFKRMPELDWTFGYPLALGVMLISMILPVLWFRSRGWLTGD